MEIDYLTQGPRSFFISVNDGPATQLDLNGSSFNSQASIVVRLSCGREPIPSASAIRTTLLLIWTVLSLPRRWPLTTLFRVKKMQDSRLSSFVRE